MAGIRRVIKTGINSKISEATGGLSTPDRVRRVRRRLAVTADPAKEQKRNCRAELTGSIGKYHPIRVGEAKADLTPRLKSGIKE
jgi:hypothetical protein